MLPSKPAQYSLSTSLIHDKEPGCVVGEQGLVGIRHTRVSFGQSEGPEVGGI